MIPKSKCLDCKKDLWDDLPPYQPKKGDSCVCIFCGCMMEFNKVLKLIHPKELTHQMKEISTIIKFLNYSKANPFNGDPDKFKIKNLLLPSQ